MGEQKSYREMAKESPAFLKACAEAGVQPTPRQFSKFAQRRGQAWAAHTNTQREDNR